MSGTRDFGTVSIAGAPSDAIVTLTNSGTDTTITAVTKPATAACAEFTLTPSGTLGTPVVVANNGTFDVAVSYDPVDRTQDTCTVTVAHSGSSGGTTTFVLTGDGAAAAMMVSTSALAFNDQRWNGGTPQDRTVTVMNIGEEATSVTGALTTDTHFAVVAPATQMVGSGESVTVTVRFDPTSLGPKSDTLTLSADNDAPTASNPTVSLSGTGIQSTQTFSPAASLNVGSYPVGGSGTANLTIGNSGAATLNLSGVPEAMSIGGANATDFAFTDHGCTGQTCNPTPSTVTASGTTIFAIRCSPSATGARAATLTVRSDDPASPRTLPLSCTGQVPMLSTNPASAITFAGTIQVGQAATTQNLVISNAAGAAPLSYAIVSNSAEFPLACAGGGMGCLSGTLAADGSATVVVGFVPSATGARTSTLTITSDDPDDNPKTITVSGTGGLPAFASSGPTFGAVPVAQAGGATAAMTISNGGTVALDISQMTITGDPTGNFSFAFGGCTSGQTCNQAISVAAGGMTTVTLRCDPSSQGSKTATLNVTSDAPTSPNTVALTCTGSVPDVTVTPTMLTFGNQRLNTNSGAQAFTISNAMATNTAPLGYAVAETSPHYSVTCVPACTGTLAAGASATVSVVFRPTATGAQSTSILVSTPDDPDTASTSVMVTGTGVEPTIALVTPTPATPPSTGGALSFGGVNVGATSAAQTITVRNTGSMDLVISGVTNTNTTDFSLSGTAPVTLAPNATASWSVSCRPSAIGARSGQIQIANDSNNDTSVDVALACTGNQGITSATASPVAISGGTINFGPVRLNEMRTTTVTVSNLGNVALTIASATLSSSTQGFSVSNFTPNTTVAAGATTTFTVTFAPTLDAQGTATLTLDTEWNDVTITLIGDGQPTGCAVDPSPITLGDVAWNATADQVVTVRNIGTASFNITSATLGGANPTELEVIGSPAGPLAGGAMRQFTLRANPSDTMLGARSAILSINTDLPSGMGCAMVPVGYTSVGPAVTITPGMVVDFGGVDVDGPAATVTLTLTNTGTGAMTITGMGALTGSFSRSSFTGPVNVARQGVQTVTLSYRPTLERDPTNPETQSFTITTTGLFANDTAQPPAIQIMVTGYGVDQHIQADDVRFPDTYRNPTDAQSANCGPGGDAECVVDVCNTGRAALNVSMVDDPADAFALAAGQARTFRVDGRTGAAPTCTPVKVRFQPTSYGELAGSITVVNDDDGSPMKLVRLSGQGIPRPVSVAPAAAPALTTIALGVPVRLSDIVPGGLVLASTATRGDFAVHAEVTEPSVLVGDDLTLSPGTSASYDVELVATEPGMQTIEVTVFLDGDPLAHPGPGPTLSIPVEVVEVDVRGGGCDGAGGGQGLALVGLVLLGLVVRRRRGVTTLVLVAGVAVGARGLARADVTRNVDLGTFTPTPSTEPGMFQVQSPEVAGKGAWSLIAALSYATNPMVAEWMQGGAPRELALVANRTELELGFAYALSRRLELAVRVPMYQQAGGDAQMSDPFGLSPADGFALGDVAVRAKATAVRGRVGLGGALEVTAPTAKDGQFAGVDGPTAHLQLLLGGHSRRLEWALNAGFLARQAAEFSGLEQGSELTYGAGVAVRVIDKVSLVGESYGSLGVVGAEGKVSPMEWALGLRVRASRALVLGVGGGTGFGQGLGSPDARGFVTLAIAPRARPLEPLKIVVPPPPRDTGDDDGDGVVNADDGCKLDAEDADQFKDEDGCPDPDNDDDGLLDGADRCPLEPEDKDGLQDEDGCIDGDNDGDGILDIDDKCPGEPEDKDGFNDNDGCDEPDNDNDGIPDVLDQCALEPETINGNNDDDGCPDKGDALVMLMQDRLEVLEAVTFVGLTAKLGKSAPKVLAQVGATMRAEQGIKRIRVTVHVHPRGPGDEALSEKRAQEIRKWLIGWGVEPERIEAKGIGSLRPLVPKTQKGAEQINDRVELIILERR